MAVATRVAVVTLPGKTVRCRLGLVWIAPLRLARLAEPTAQDKHRAEAKGAHAVCGRRGDQVGMGRRRFVGQPSSPAACHGGPCTLRRTKRLPLLPAGRLALTV